MIAKPMRGTGVRHHFEDAPDDREELSWWAGILSATIEDLAEAIGVEVEAVERAVERGEAEPLVDTAVGKSRRGDEEERPTSPELRSLALVEEEFEALLETTGGEDPRTEG
jgi:hypothetical protein